MRCQPAPESLVAMASKPLPRKAGVPFSADCQGGMFGFFLLPELPQNYAKVMTRRQP
jgi:hypothetical protein